jgi:hypothetical protein
MTAELIPENPDAKQNKVKVIVLCVGAAIPLIVTAILFLTGATKSKAEKYGPTVDWLLYRELDLRTNRPSDRLAAFDGKKIVSPGFMVPLEDNRNEVTEFLLVPNAQACIHAPPPPTNQMVYVRMVNGPAKSVFGPIKVAGTLRVSAQDHQYGSAGFQIYGDFVEKYE